MKLYASTTSPFSRLCIIVGYLSKKDLALQFVMPWENPAELLAVNPYSQIPALVCDNGQVLTETLIIADYLNKDILAAGDPKISFAITTLSQVVKTFTLQLHAAAAPARAAGQRGHCAGPKTGAGIGYGQRPLGRYIPGSGPGLRQPAGAGHL